MDRKVIGSNSVSIRLADDRPPNGASKGRPAGRGEVLLDQRGVRREEQLVRQAQAEDGSCSESGGRSRSRRRERSYSEDRIRRRERGAERSDRRGNGADGRNR